MKLDQDRVPRNLDEAVEMVMAALEPEDRTFILTQSFPVAAVHHSIGRYLRNNWSLWEEATPLVQWFRTALKVGHADDISSLVLEAVVARVTETPFDLQAKIKYLHEFWAAQGCDEFGGRKTA